MIDSSFKPDCNGAMNFKFIIKTGGSLINSQEIIDQKFKELKDAKKSVRGNVVASGAKHMGEEEITQNSHESDEISDTHEVNEIALAQV